MLDGTLLLYMHTTFPDTRLAARRGDRPCARSRSRANSHLHIHRFVTREPCDCITLEIYLLFCMERCSQLISVLEILTPLPTIPNTDYGYFVYIHLQQNKHARLSLKQCHLDIKFLAQFLTRICLWQGCAICVNPTLFPYFNHLSVMNLTILQCYLFYFIVSYSSLVIYFKSQTSSWLIERKKKIKKKTLRK